MRYIFIIFCSVFRSDLFPTSFLIRDTNNIGHSFDLLRVSNLVVREESLPALTTRVRRGVIVLSQGWVFVQIVICHDCLVLDFFALDFYSLVVFEQRQSLDLTFHLLCGHSWWILLTIKVVWLGRWKWKRAKMMVTVWLRCWWYLDMELCQAVPNHSQSLVETE